MIREINISDCNEVLTLVFQLDANDHSSSLKKISEKINDIKTKDYIKIYGYETQGKIVGMVTICRIEGITQGCRPFSIIENVVVDEKSRNKGIGSMLLKHAIEIAEKWNCYKIVLETGTKKEWKLQYYENSGFTRGVKTAFIKRFSE